MKDVNILKNALLKNERYKNNILRIEDITRKLEWKFSEKNNKLIGSYEGIHLFERRLEEEMAGELHVFVSSRYETIGLTILVPSLATFKSIPFPWKEFIILDDTLEDLCIVYIKRKHV